jgi:Pvc16 N-terminal domain/Carboxypeptidase regulatory-like domain
MIRDLDETLRAVLHDPAQMAQFPELAAADIAFDRPTDPYAPGQPTVNLFLYELRENTELRSNDPEITIVNGKAITRPAPMRLYCSYLVTAWPIGMAEPPLQEHRLLTQALRVLSRYPTLPEAFLKGSLIGQTPPLPMVTLHPDSLKAMSEFWTSLGNRMRASLTVTVTISVPVFADVPDFLVTTHRTSYVPAAQPSEQLLQVGGRVLDGNTALGISGAMVDLLDTGQQTISTDDGTFDFATVPPGPHTLRATAAGYAVKLQPLTIPGRAEDYQITLTHL